MTTILMLQRDLKKTIGKTRAAREKNLLSPSQLILPQTYIQLTKSDWFWEKDLFSWLLLYHLFYVGFRIEFKQTDNINEVPSDE